MHNEFPRVIASTINCIASFPPTWLEPRIIAYPHRASVDGEYFPIFTLADERSNRAAVSRTMQKPSDKHGAVPESDDGLVIISPIVFKER